MPPPAPVQVSGRESTTPSVSSVDSKPVGEKKKRERKSKVGRATAHYSGGEGLPVGDQWVCLSLITMDNCSREDLDHIKYL